MSKDNKHTQGSPGDFEDKIDAAMADLEADPDEESRQAATRGRQEWQSHPYRWLRP